MSEHGSDRSDTERELMHATGAALAEHGVAGLTTQRIADEWGRAQSLVHYYHDTKEDLVVAYIQFLRENQRQNYAERADDPPLDRIEWLVADNLAADTGGSLTVNVLYDLHGEAPHNERYQAALNDLETDAREFLENAVRDGTADGTFRDVDPAAAAMFLLSASDGALLRTVSLHRGEDAALFHDGAGRFVADALLTGDAREAWDGFGSDG